MHVLKRLCLEGDNLETEVLLWRNDLEKYANFLVYVRRKRLDLLFVGIADINLPVYHEAHLVGNALLTVKLIVLRDGRQNESFDVDIHVED